MFALCSKPILALTSPVLVINNDPLTPAPPATTSAPVSTLELTVPDAAIMLPSTVSVVVITSLYSYETLLTIKLPPTYKLPAIPAPPLTTRAPVSNDDASVVDITTRLLFGFVPILLLA